MKAKYSKNSIGKKHKDNMFLVRIVKKLNWSVNDTEASSESPFHRYTITCNESTCTLEIQTLEEKELVFKETFKDYEEAVTIADNHCNKQIANYVSGLNSAG